MCYSKRQYDNRFQKLQELKSAMAALEKEYNAVRDDIINDMAGDVVETDRFRGKLSISEQHRPNYKKLCAKYGPDEIADCVTVSVSVSLRVTEL